MKPIKKTEILNAIGEIQTLKNMLGDLIPAQSYDTAQLSNIETLIENNRYYSLTQNRVVLAYMYCEHALLQTAIHQPIQDALRGGVTITSPELDADDLALFSEKQEDAGDMATLEEALTWEDLFGGSALIINVDVNPAQPWNIKSSKPKKLEFYAADRWELNGGMRGGDEKEIYNFYGTRIHRTRLLELSGMKPPAFIRPQYQGWGMSKAEKMVRELNAFMKHNDVIFQLLDEAKIDVYSIKNFNSSCATDSGTAKVKKRITIANQIKNYERAIIMDTNDKYDQKTLTFGGLAEILKELRIGLASAFRIPISKLFGTGASGLNSAQDDLENYNGMVESEIRQRMRRPLRVMISLRMLQIFGYIPKFKFEFRPLRETTEADLETIKTSRQARLITWYDKALITSKELGQAAHAYDLLPIETEMAQGLLDDHPVPPDSQAQAGNLLESHDEQHAQPAVTDVDVVPEEPIKTPIEEADTSTQRPENGELPKSANLNADITLFYKEKPFTIKYNGFKNAAEVRWGKEMVGTFQPSKSDNPIFNAFTDEAAATRLIDKHTLSIKGKKK